MAQIKKTIVKEKNLTVFSVCGYFGLDQLIDEIDRLYANDFTLHTLWDLSDADISSIDANQVRRIIAYSKKYLSYRKRASRLLLCQATSIMVWVECTIYFLS